MMLRVAWKMLMHGKARFGFIVLGLGVLFLLSAAQVGMLVGWCNTNSAIIDHAGVDIWVMAEQTPAFDYGTAIPRNRIYQVRSIEGVAWAEGMFMAWNYWQRKDGRRVNVELVGLDTSSVGGPWSMRLGRVENVHLPDSVIVDELYLPLLGSRSWVTRRRCLVGGLLLAASPSRSVLSPPLHSSSLPSDPRSSTTSGMTWTKSPMCSCVVPPVTDSLR